MQANEESPSLRKKSLPFQFTLGMMSHGLLTRQDLSSRMCFVCGKKSGSSPASNSLCLHRKHRQKYTHAHTRGGRLRGGSSTEEIQGREVCLGYRSGCFSIERQNTLEGVKYQEQRDAGSVGRCKMNGSNKSHGRPKYIEHFGEGKTG